MVLFVFNYEFTYSWGFHAHRIINEKAVYCLPEEMFGFYKANIDYLYTHSVDPDKRRYAVKEEAPRHYLDIDHFFVNASSLKRNELFKVLPMNYDSAISKYSQDTLSEHGILPWYLNEMLGRLTGAFLTLDMKQVLKISAEIGHYCGDAHVPLHTTENYNGQLTGQKGIHGLWESRIPERFSEKYNYLTGKAEYLNNVQESIWDVIIASHQSVNFVLKTEKDLRNSFPEDKIYRPSTTGKGVTPQYTSAYVDAYAESNNKLVEKRMQEAIHFTASLWYTAWVNAGQPQLFQKMIYSGDKSEEHVSDSELEHER